MDPHFWEIPAYAELMEPVKMSVWENLDANVTKSILETTVT